MRFKINFSNEESVKCKVQRHFHRINHCLLHFLHKSISIITTVLKYRSKQLPRHNIQLYGRLHQHLHGNISRYDRPSNPFLLHRSPLQQKSPSLPYPIPNPRINPPNNRPLPLHLLYINENAISNNILYMGSLLSDSIPPLNLQLYLPNPIKSQI